MYGVLLIHLIEHISITFVLTFCHPPYPNQNSIINGYTTHRDEYVCPWVCATPTPRFSRRNSMDWKWKPLSSSFISLQTLKRRWRYLESPQKDVSSQEKTNDTSVSVRPTTNLCVPFASTPSPPKSASPPLDPPRLHFGAPAYTKSPSRTTPLLTLSFFPRFPMSSMDMRRRPRKVGCHTSTLTGFRGLVRRRVEEVETKKNKGRHL